jgi:hypothetical protein
MMPRKVREPPSELDRLDPAPKAARPPRAPRAPVRRKGPAETAVLRDLRALPDDLRQGGIAAAALQLARALDAGDMSPRDLSATAAQLRMSLVTLREIAPGEAKGDHTDEVRERRERRLSQDS